MQFREYPNIYRAYPALITPTELRRAGLDPKTNEVDAQLEKILLAHQGAGIESRLQEISKSIGKLPGDPDEDPTGIDREGLEKVFDKDSKCAKDCCNVGLLESIACKWDKFINACGGSDQCGPAKAVGDAGAGIAGGLGGLGEQFSQGLGGFGAGFGDFLKNATMPTIVIAVAVILIIMIILIKR